MLAVLYAQGPASRLQLAEKTGLSPAALTSISRDLLRSGLVREGESVRPAGNGRGPGHTLLEVHLGHLGIVGLTYGRESLQAAIVNLAGTVYWHRRWEQPSKGSPAKVRRRLAQAVQTALRESPIRRGHLVALVVGNPGLIDRDQGRIVRALDFPGWENVPLRDLLHRECGLPVVLEGKAFLQALGELEFGAGRDARAVLWVGASATGVGGAFVERNRSLPSGRFSAGEIGHMRVSEGGRLCRCGQRGCLEAQVAIPRLLEQYRAARKADGLDLTALARRAQEGDPVCRRIFKSAAEKLAWAIGSAVRLLQPQRILLGERWVEAGDALLDPLRGALVRSIPHQSLRGIDVRFAELGAMSVFQGAAALVREKLLASPTQH